jgi:translation initiation factor 2 beta subunit (eIF-2beta)/eIF-5
MPKVNIPNSATDPTYRYKRDKIEITIQNTNGGITKLLNIDKIAVQLGTKQDEILKFLKKKANTSIIEKNGPFLRKSETVENIENMLEDFIKKEILCPLCNNPEFTAEIVKKTCIKTCKACGHSRTDL